MIGGKTPLEEFQKIATYAFIEMQKKREKGTLHIFDDLSRRLDRIELEGKELKGPSSTWTYLISDEQSGWGVEMGMGRNIGFAAGAALALGPLYLFLGIYNRWIKKS